MIGGAFLDRSYRRLIDFGVGAVQQNFVVHQSLRDPVRPQSVNARLSPLSPCQTGGALSPGGVDSSQACRHRPAPVEAQHRNSFDFARLSVWRAATRSATTAATHPVAQQAESERRSSAGSPCCTNRSFGSEE